MKVSIQTVAMLGVALTGILIAVVAAEVFLRTVAVPHWNVRAKPNHDTLLSPHPVRGYFLTPGTDRSWSRADWTVRVRFNQRGMRAAPFPELRRADVRILAVGDSFTMGIGVEADEVWAMQLQGMLANQLPPGTSVRVANTGVPGYSARQMRLTAEEFLADFEPQTVIFALYASSYWRIKNPYVKLGEYLVSTSELPYLDLREDGSLAKSNFESESVRRIDFWLKRHFYVGAQAWSLAALVLGADSRRPFTPISTRAEFEVAYAPTLEEILRTRIAAERAGAEFVVLLVNLQEPDGSYSPEEFIYNEIVLKFCEEHEIRLVDPLPEFVERSRGRRLFAYPDDIHWTPAAHRIAAQQLHALLTRPQLIEPLSPDQLTSELDNLSEASR